MSSANPSYLQWLIVIVVALFRRRAANLAGLRDQAAALLIDVGICPGGRFVPLIRRKVAMPFTNLLSAPVSAVPAIAVRIWQARRATTAKLHESSPVVDCETFYARNSAHKMKYVAPKAITPATMPATSAMRPMGIFRSITFRRADCARAFP